MKVQIYYGQYSLKYWIHLMLSGNIVLPEYQRIFVWNQEDVENFIDSLKEGQYVQPVTIGREYRNGMDSNQIIDGQQRLTSILLAYLELFPEKDTFRYTGTVLAGSGASAGIDDDSDEDEILDWRYPRLLKYKNETLDSKDSIREAAFKIPNGYHSMNLALAESFFEDTFLGFSYIVPQTKNEKEQRGYYAKLFRNINAEGVRLKDIESRKALYYISSDFEDFFDPDFCKNLKIGKEQLDFTRLLALLTQYHHDGNASQVASRYKKRLEEYYVEFIFSMVDASDEKHELFGSFFDHFHSKNDKAGVDMVVARIKKISPVIASLNLPTEYKSIIEADVFLAGLVYEMVFLDKEPSAATKDALVQELKDKVAEFQGDNSHTRSPGSLSKLRSRLTDSIGIYEKYV